jgi:hypothetical protein
VQGYALQGLPGAIVAFCDIVEADHRVIMPQGAWFP